MNKKIFVVGHKNPDTDSIVSAIVASDYLAKKGFNAQAYRSGELSKETKFVLSFLREKEPLRIKNLKGKNVFLVDHGELAQSPDGVEQDKILGVFDHHKMAGLITAEPIFYRAEPLGSTSTLVAKIFEEQNLKLNKKQAGLLLLGIISDTLKFTSPTTTEQDKRISQKLNKICKVNIEDVSQKMFEAKSDISGMKIGDLVKRDYKDFYFGGKKVGIGVFETTSTKPIEKLKEKIFAKLQKLKSTEKTDFLFWGLVDILKKETSLYLIGKEEKEIAEKVFKGELKEENIMILTGIVSRKKQIVPPLSKFFEK